MSRAASHTPKSHTRRPGRAIARAKPKPKSKRRNSTADASWHLVRDIIDEKVQDGGVYYRIDWAGTDEHGHPYEPSWEPAALVNDEALSAWRDKKSAGLANAAHATSQETALSSQAATDESTQETDRVLPPNWRRSHGKRGGADIDAAQAGSDRGAPIVVEIPHSSTFRTSEYRALQETQQTWQSSSQPSSQQQERLRPDCARQIRSLDQVIPDSQEPSGFSTGLSNHNSYPLASQQTDSQASLAEPTEDISSHQRDSFSAARLSANALPAVSHHSSHPSSIGYLTQVASDWDTVHATSPAGATRNNVVPDSQNTVVSQHTNSQHSHHTDRPSSPRNSQAAQIVQPLSSQIHGTISQGLSDVSIYDEDTTIPETASDQRKVHSNHFSQALSEVKNGNTKTSAVTYEVPATASSSSRATVQSHTSTPSTVAPSTPTKMDQPEPIQPVLSTRERLRQLREQNFRSPSSVPATESPAMSVAGTQFSTPRQEAVGDGKGDDDKAQSVVPSVLDTPSALPWQPVGSVDTPEATSTLGSHRLSIVSAGMDTQSSNGVPEADNLPGFNDHPMEHTTTLDPSALTLSIEDPVENDVQASPSVLTDDGFTTGLPDGDLPMRISDEDGSQENFPQSLIPHIPTGPSEYIVTLPFQASSRPLYNDILRENETLINEYNSSFQVLPHETPRQSTIQKLDAMFSRLFDICDFPPFLDTTRSLPSNQIAKHMLDTNSKFAFIAELLDLLQQYNSDKTILILARAGELLDLLGHLISSKGHRCVRADGQITDAIDANHNLTIAIFPTDAIPETLPQHCDVVIAFDYTYRPELSAAIEADHLVTLALVTVTSIQHINMSITDDLQPLERKNVLMMALVKAMGYIEDPEPSSFLSLVLIADKFAKRIQMPEDDDDEFYWDPDNLPPDLFKDLHAVSSQFESSAAQIVGSGKRPYIEDGEHRLPKRPKLHQPAVVTNLSHVSDKVKVMLDKDPDSADEATAVVSIKKLEDLQAKNAALESKLHESRVRAKQFQKLSERAQEEVNNHVATENTIQRRYMEALEERGNFEAACKAAKKEASHFSASLDSARGEIASLKETRAELKKKLAEANATLVSSSNPEVSRTAGLENELAAAKAQIASLEKKVTIAEVERDQIRTTYNQATQRAMETSAENRAYDQQVKNLQRKADETITEANTIQSTDNSRELQRLCAEKSVSIRQLELENNRLKEELRVARNGRRETRQSSVPRSPRMAALGMSPRNGRGPSAMGPSSSRGTSPAAPENASSGNGQSALFNQTPSGANRFAHLRDP
ncbi:hypothetical protein GGR57DRAFT_461047 [Xylariaceae sp. FL1272]|nr:hypothetical protein GGR57DRAFT_461047 [Xylariaceae sp. FL1272]